MKLTFGLDATKVEKQLANLGRGLSDFRQPFTEAGDDLLRFYGVEVFDTQGQASGDRWKDLAATTWLMREKRQGYYANPPIERNKILVWTGRMQRGFKKDVGRDTLRIFNEVPYFKYHQLSQRKMLTINERVISTVTKRVFEHVLNEVDSPI